MISIAGAHMYPQVRRRNWLIAASVIGAGTALLWICKAVTAETTPHLVDIRIGALADAEPAPIADTTFWKVVGDARPPAASLSTFVSADRKFEAGVSQYQRVTLELRDWPIDEFMYIVEGQVEITPTGSPPRVYGPGDAFVMPRGFNGTWRQLSDLKKIQVMYPAT